MPTDHPALAEIEAALVEAQEAHYGAHCFDDPGLAAALSSLATLRRDVGELSAAVEEDLEFCAPDEALRIRAALARFTQDKETPDES